MSAAARPILHILLFATRDSCGLLSCWLHWASSWLVAEAFVDYRLHLGMHTPTGANISATGEFRSSRWLEVLRARLSFISGTIHSLPLGSNVMFSDLDVVPLMPPASLLPLPYNITFMREPPGHGGRTGRHIVNAGLYAMHVSTATRKFVNHWVWLTRQYPRMMDQDTANWILLAKPGQPMHHSDLDWGTWPRSLATGLLDDIAPNETVAFHAIFTTGTRAKLARISEALVRGGGAVARLPACAPQPEGCPDARVT